MKNIEKLISGKFSRSVHMLCMFLMAVVASQLLVGCTTFKEGTKRQVMVTANVPGVNATLKTRSKEITKPLPASFTLNTKDDRGNMTLTAIDSLGNQKIANLEWINEDSATMYGGAAVGTVVFGVGGIASLVTDLYMKSYKGLSDDMIVFDFLSGSSQVVGAYPVVSTQTQRQPLQMPAQSPAPSEPCPPIQEQGQVKKFVYGP